MAAWPRAPQVLQRDLLMGRNARFMALAQSSEPLFPVRTAAEPWEPAFRAREEVRWLLSPALLAAGAATQHQQPLQQPLDRLPAVKVAPQSATQCAGHAGTTAAAQAVGRPSPTRRGAAASPKSMALGKEDTREPAALHVRSGGGVVEPQEPAAAAKERAASVHLLDDCAESPSSAVAVAAAPSAVVVQRTDSEEGAELCEQVVPLLL